MFYTPLVLVTLLNISSAFTSSITPEQVCRVVTITSTGEPQWQPTPDAQVFVHQPLTAPSSTSDASGRYIAATSTSSPSSNVPSPVYSGDAYFPKPDVGRGNSTTTRIRYSSSADQVTHSFNGAAEWNDWKTGSHGAGSTNSGHRSVFSSSSNRGNPFTVPSFAGHATAGLSSSMNATSSHSQTWNISATRPAYVSSKTSNPSMTLYATSSDTANSPVRLSSTLPRSSYASNHSPAIPISFTSTNSLSTTSSTTLLTEVIDGTTVTFGHHVQSPSTTASFGPYEPSSTNTDQLLSPTNSEVSSAQGSTIEHTTSDQRTSRESVFTTTNLADRTSITTVASSTTTSSAILVGADVQITSSSTVTTSTISKSTSTSTSVNSDPTEELGQSSTSSTTSMSSFEGSQTSSSTIYVSSTTSSSASASTSTVSSAPIGMIETSSSTTTSTLSSTTTSTISSSTISDSSSTTSGSSSTTSGSSSTTSGSSSTTSGSSSTTSGSSSTTLLDAIAATTSSMNSLTTSSTSSIDPSTTSSIDPSTTSFMDSSVSPKATSSTTSDSSSLMSTASSTTSTEGMTSTMVETSSTSSTALLTTSNAEQTSSSTTTAIYMTTSYSTSASSSTSTSTAGDSSSSTITSTSITSTTTTTSDQETSSSTASTLPSSFTTTNLYITTSYLFSNSSATSTTSVGNFTTTSTSSSTIATAAGSESTFAGPVDLGSVPLATLLPVSPPDIDMGSLDVLNAQPTTNLWFNGADAGGDEENGAVTVRVTVGYKFASVVLDHSIYIQSTTCSSSTITIRFTNAEAYNRAVDKWISSPMIFITAATGCGVDGQPLFFQSTFITFEGELVVKVSGQPTTLADVYESLDVDFGKIQYTEPTPVSSSNYSSSVCGSPSSPTISGLPAVACGSAFDQLLDTTLGMYADGGLSRAEVLGLAEPEVDMTGLQKRGFLDWLFDIIKTVFDWIIDVVVTVVKTVLAPILPPFVNQALDWVADTAKKVVDVGIAIARNTVKLATFIVTGDYSNSLTLPMNLTPPTASLVQSPWGPALKFYSWTPEAGGEKWTKSATRLEQMEGLIGEPDPEPGFEFFCVNCGVSGQVTATGSVSATILSGLKHASIGVNGNVYAGLYLGVNAFAEYEKVFEKDLYSRGLPGWSVPGIVSLGPILTLGVEARLTADAEGQLLTGASLTWPDFYANLDFIDSSQTTQHGWTPQIQHTFQATGDLSATASLGMPIKVEFGIDILDGKFKKTAALVDTPAIAAHAELTISLDTDAEDVVTVGDDDCAGIAWDISLTNEVALEITDLARWTLVDWSSPPLDSGCIAIGSSGGNSGETGGGIDGTVNDAAPSSTTTAFTVPNLTSIVSISTPTATVQAANTCDSPFYERVNFGLAPHGGQYTDAERNAYDISCVQISNFGYLAGNFPGHTVQSCLELCGKTDACTFMQLGPNGPGYCDLGYSLNGNSLSLGGPSQENPAVSAAVINPFTIYSVYWGPWDTTDEASAWWMEASGGKSVKPDTTDWTTKLGDPTPNELKHKHMIYAWGSELRTYAAHQDVNDVVIWPGEIPTDPVGDVGGPPLIQQVSRVVPVVNVVNPLSEYFSIIDICWGDVFVADYNLEAVWSGIYSSVLTGAGVTFGYNAFSTGAHCGYNNLGRCIGTIFIEIKAQPGVIVAINRFNGVTVPSSTFGVPDSALKPVKKIKRATDTTTSTSLTTTTSTTGLSTFILTDITSTLQLNISPNNNLFMSNLQSTADITSLLSPSTLIGGTSSSIIAATDTNTLLHYHPSEMAATGVSRLRLATWDNLPRGSRLINLIPLTYEDSGVSAIVAADSSSNAYFLYMCAFGDQLNKVFLANTHDLATAEEWMKRDGMEFVVTGGKVTECGPLALKATMLGAVASSAQ